MLKRIVSLATMALLAVLVLTACGGSGTKKAEPTVTRAPATNAPAPTNVATPAAAPSAKGSPAASPGAKGSPAASPGAKGSPTASPAAKGSPVAPAGGTTATGSLTVTAGQPSELQFQPTDLTIAANTETTITVKNGGALAHNFSVDALKINVDLQPGDTKEVKINAKPGDYEYYCNVPGHKGAGMTGKIHVK